MGWIYFAHEIDENFEGHREGYNGLNGGPSKDMSWFLEPVNFTFFFQKWMFKDRIKLRILSWGDHRVLFSGVLNPMRCICVRVRQGYFTVRGRNFKQQNHHEKTQWCEKKCGTELTMRKTVVYESSEKRVKLRFIWPPLGSACQEGQNFCWILYGWKWPQNA